MPRERLKVDPWHPSRGVTAVVRRKPQQRPVMMVCAILPFNQLDRACV
jgi:hypothetical protein